MLRSPLPPDPSAVDQKTEETDNQTGDAEVRQSMADCSKSTHEYNEAQANTGPESVAFVKAGPVLFNHPRPEKSGANRATSRNSAVLDNEGYSDQNQHEDDSEHLFILLFTVIHLLHFMSNLN